MKIYQELPSIDCAVIDHKGNLVGESFKPHVEISGAVTETEQVIVDFGTIKTFLKNALEGTEGLDHKVWNIKGYSALGSVSWFSDCNSYRLNTKQVQAFIPEDGLANLHCEFHNPVSHKLAINQAATLWFDEISKQAETLFGVQVKLITLEATFSVNPYSFHYVRKYSSMIHYCHVLPNSTSYGCNTIHGHQSSIEVYTEDPYAAIDGLISILDSIFPTTCFLSRQSQPPKSQKILQEFSGLTCKKRLISVSTTNAPNIVYLGADTTVENIGLYVQEKVKHIKLDKPAIITISEGLNKGVTINV